MSDKYSTDNGPTRKRFRGTRLPFAALLLVTALFRSTQNAVQTTFGPFGHILLRLSPSIVRFGIALTGAVVALANFWLVKRLHSARLRRLAFVGLLGTSIAICVVVLGGSLPTLSNFGGDPWRIGRLVDAGTSHTGRSGSWSGKR